MESRSASGLPVGGRFANTLRCRLRNAGGVGGRACEIPYCELPRHRAGKAGREVSLMGRRAFTLIELLVVIAIIAILAAILFPVFAQVREKGRQTQCLSNTRQFGTAVMMYVQDYGECYPLSIYPARVNGGVGPFTVFDAVLPYVRNNGIMSC